MTLWRTCLTCGEVSDGAYCEKHRESAKRTGHSKEDRRRYENRRDPDRYGDDWTPELRAAILSRDGHECQIEGPGCTFRATTVDHIIARSRGGTNDPSNLRAACNTCNGRKSAKPR